MCLLLRYLLRMRKVQQGQSFKEERFTMPEAFLSPSLPVISNVSEPSAPQPSTSQSDYPPAAPSPSPIPSPFQRTSKKKLRNSNNMASPAFMEIPEEVKRNVRAVLLSKVGGVPTSQFLKDYKALLCEPLEFKQLGFSSLQECLKCMPEVARIEKTNKGEKIFGVGEPNTYMPISARKAQGRLPKNYHKKLEKESKERKQEEEPSDSSSEKMNVPLEPDTAGLYTICMPIEKCPTIHQQELETIFSQAGDVKKSMYTKKWVFVRYATKKEIYKSLQLFANEFGVRIANPAKPKEGGESTEQSTFKRGQNEKQPTEKDTQNNSENEVKQKKGKGKTNHVMASKKDAWEEMNGYHSERELPNGFSPGSYERRGNRKDSGSLMAMSDNKLPEKTSLFVANIDSEKDFREVIKPYGPINIEVRKKNKDLMYAFLEMRCEEDARRVIADIHNTRLKKLSLFVDFDKIPANEKQPSENGIKSNHHHANSSKAPSHQRSPKMPQLQTDYTNMPPLVHMSQFGQDMERYNLDCCIFVANFPSNSLESSLRNAFSRYHVLDICMVNNGSGVGCTKAFLYLATVYDVILAVSEMNGSTVFGHGIKVDVPFVNTLLKSVVNRELSRQMDPYQQMGTQQGYHYY